MGAYHLQVARGARGLSARGFGTLYDLLKLSTVGSCQTIALHLTGISLRCTPPKAASFFSSLEQCLASCAQALPYTGSTSSKSVQWMSRVGDSQTRTHFPSLKPPWNIFAISFFPVCVVFFSIFRSRWMGGGGGVNGGESWERVRG